MEIVPLGVGDAFAKTLKNSNYLISPSEGEPFLLDCGGTATRALLLLGVEPREVSQILISHLHGDHAGGLEEMGFSGKFLWGHKVNLFIPDPLMQYLWPNELSGPMGQRLDTGDGDWVEADLDTYFTVVELKPFETVRFGSVQVTPFPTPHINGRPSWGFHMKETVTGASVMFTCDSQFDMGNLDKYGTDAKLIFHDCQLGGGASSIHTNLDDLLALERQWQERILLVHYGDQWREYEGATGLMRFAREGEVYKV